MNLIPSWLPLFFFKEGVFFDEKSKKWIRQDFKSMDGDVAILLEYFESECFNKDQFFSDAKISC